MTFNPSPVKNVQCIQSRVGDEYYMFSYLPDIECISRWRTNSGNDFKKALILMNSNNGRRFSRHCSPHYNFGSRSSTDITNRSHCLSNKATFFRIPDKIRYFLVWERYQDMHDNTCLLVRMRMESVLRFGLERGIVKGIVGWIYNFSLHAATTFPIKGTSRSKCNFFSFWSF